MATSVHNTNTNPQASIHLREDRDHQPIRRGSTGRRKTKGSEAGGQKKKQPQRGMGVAQLERLRMQENGKTTSSHTLTINPASFSDTNGNLVPMQFAKLGGFGTLNGGVGQMGLNQDHNFFGFPEHMGNGDDLVSDPFGVAGWNSKELSSTPKTVKCYYEQCNVCHKKKRVRGENLGCTRVESAMYMQMSPISNRDFLGLNVGGIYQENPVEIQAPIVPLAAYSVHNSQPGVEVVAFHRKGHSSSGSGTVLMEYEFFPKKFGSRSTCSNELVMTNLGASSEPSSVEGKERETAYAASSAIDLSLKLSY